MRDTLGLLGIMGDPQHSETRLYSSGDQRLDLPPKKWTGLGRHTLSESWADVAQGRMQATGIVEALDILEEVSASLGAGAINPMVNPLGLEAVKEAFHWRVVQTITFTAHRGCYT